MTSNTLIDAQHYPIDQTNSEARKAIVDQVKQSLALDGYAVLPNFLNADGLQTLLSEANSLKSQAYYSENKASNVYLRRPRVQHVHQCGTQNPTV